MGVVKKFFRNLLVEVDPWRGRHSERDITIEMESHLSVVQYGSFELTDAVRPAIDLPVVPTQGFRRDRYIDRHRRVAIPVLIGAVSAEQLFDTFLDLLNPLGEMGGIVDVILETSQHHTQGTHRNFLRRDVELLILKSLLYDAEEMLLHDGCVGLAVMHPTEPLEVQFDEHKLLTVYARDLTAFEAIFRRHGVLFRPRMKTIPEAEHLHSSHDRFAEQFTVLQHRLCAEEY